MKTLNFKILPLLMSAFILFIAAVDDSKESERILRSAQVISDLGQIKEGIPHDLIKGAEGVIIIPKLINAGWVLAASGARA